MSVTSFRPVHRTLYQPVYHREQPQPRLTLRAVLWNYYLLWIAKNPLANLGRTAALGSCTLLIAMGVFAPWSLYQASLHLATWNGYKVPLFCVGLALLLNWRRLYRFLRRPRSSTSKSANQHTYQGIPVDELASKLLEWGAFKLDQATKGLGITQPKWSAIARELEGHQVLVRGECNALVLNTITREQLVRCLGALAAGKAPPIVFDTDRAEWNERDGSWELHLREKERQQEKETERVVRFERRVVRAEKALERTKEEASVFQQIRAGTLA
jgi:hypothetical protein